MGDNIIDEAAATVNGSAPRHRPQRCPSHILKRLGEKRCPVCAKDCVPKKGGWDALGWFLGCPDFPKCPGKLSKDEVKDCKVTEEGKVDALEKLRKALDYVAAMGGTKEALKWLRIASESVSNTNDEPIK